MTTHMITPPTMAGIRTTEVTTPLPNRIAITMAMPRRVHTATELSAESNPSLQALDITTARSTEFSAMKPKPPSPDTRSEEHTSELQSHSDLVCRLLLEKKKKHKNNT